MTVCAASAFVGGLKDVASHLQSDEVATVSSIYFVSELVLSLIFFIFVCICGLFRVVVFGCTFV